jgi:hypothetical protein
MSLFILNIAWNPYQQPIVLCPRPPFFALFCRCVVENRVNNERQNAICSPCIQLTYYIAIPTPLKPLADAKAPRYYKVLSSNIFSPPNVFSPLPHFPRSPLRANSFQVFLRVTSLSRENNICLRGHLSWWTPRAALSSQCKPVHPFYFATLPSLETLYKYSIFSPESLWCLNICKLVHPNHPCITKYSSVVKPFPRFQNLPVLQKLLLS